MQQQCKILAGHHGLSVHKSCRAGDKHAHPVDLEVVEPVDSVSDDLLVAPTHHPEGCGAVEEVVLARAFPNEMPGVLAIHANRAAPVAVGRLKLSREFLLDVALTIRNGIGILAGSRGHEADAEYAAIRRIAESFDVDGVLCACLSERSLERRIDERVARIGSSDVHRDFDEIICLDSYARLRKRDFFWRCHQSR